jgi:hypothetical protein
MVSPHKPLLKLGVPLVRKACGTLSYEIPQGSTFVGTGSDVPEVHELLSAQGIARPPGPRGTSFGDWSSRLGVGRRANNPVPLKHLLFRNPRRLRLLSSDHELIPAKCKRP